MKNGVKKPSVLVAEADVHLSFAQALRQLVCSWRYLVPTIIVAIASFAFFLTHYAINVDDLSGWRYFSGELIAQGRFTWPLISMLCGIDGNVPPVADVFGIVAHTASALAFSALFVSRSNGRFSVASATVFSALYLSCPLVTESFSYAGLSVAIGFGSLIAAVAIALTSARTSSTVRMLLYCAIAIALLVFGISWYESVASVYMCATMFVLILCNRVDLPVRLQLREAAIDGCRAALTLAVAVVAEWAISEGLIAALGIEHSHNASNVVGIATGSGMGEVLREWLFDYGVMGLFYLPIAVLVLACFAALVLAAAEAWRTRLPVRPVLYMGMLLSLVSISLLSGAAAPYRTAQVVPFFVACIGAMCFSQLHPPTHRAKRVSIALSEALCCLLIVLQIVDTNHWFMVDWERYVQERGIVQAISDDLHKRGIEHKPVIFVGKFHLDGTWEDAAYVSSDDMRAVLLESAHNFGRVHLEYDKCLKVQQLNEYITWAQGAFGSQSELFAFFEWCGCPLVEPDVAAIPEYAWHDVELPDWPEPDSIMDRGDFVVVKLGATFPQ